MQTGEILIYRTDDGQMQINVKLEQDTIWLTQRQIADLLGTEVPAISKHISNILETNELDGNQLFPKWK